MTEDDNCMNTVGFIDLCRYGNNSLVIKQIEDGYDVNSKSPHWVNLNIWLLTVLLMLNMPIKMFYLQPFFSALATACRFGRTHTAELLVIKGADIGLINDVIIINLMYSRSQYIMISVVVTLRSQAILLWWRLVPQVTWTQLWCYLSTVLILTLYQRW